MQTLRLYKYIECFNFWTINVKYIIVYIFWMEMSQRINLWHHILLRILFFWENCNNNNKNLDPKFIGRSNKNSFG